MKNKSEIDKINKQINIRRLSLYIEEIITDNLKDFVWEIKDENTKYLMLNNIKNILNHFCKLDIIDSYSIESSYNKKELNWIQKVFCEEFKRYNYEEILYTIEILTKKFDPLKPIKLEMKIEI